MVYKNKSAKASDIPVLSENLNSGDSISPKEIKEFLDPNYDGIINVQEAKEAARKIMEASMKLHPQETRAVLDTICADPEGFAKDAAMYQDGSTAITYKTKSTKVTFKISEEALLAGLKSVCGDQPENNTQEIRLPPEEISPPSLKPTPGQKKQPMEVVSR